MTHGEGLTICFAMQGESCRGSVQERVQVVLHAIRQHLPKAWVVQLSNATFPAAPGVDAVHRRANEGDFIRWAFRSMLDLLADRNPVLQLATDIIVRRDVSEVFDQDFDVAACRYPERPTIYCGDTNFIQQGGRRLWETALDLYEATPHLHDGWEGGQTAFTLAMSRARVRVRDLDSQVYNFTPDRPGQIPASAALVHYRGVRKDFLLQDFPLPERRTPCLAGSLG